MCVQHHRLNPSVLDAKSRDAARAELQALFQPGVANFAYLNGDRRPGEFKGHEHFGYLDGISQPAIRFVRLDDDIVFSSLTFMAVDLSNPALDKSR